ncbi:MAG: Panacea domain-containing protein [Pseudonocardiales bacterium]
MAGVDDVAAALLIRTGPVTTMKLQKLVFYSQAWHLAFTGSPLFPETIQAWARGPVVPELHRQHRRRYRVTDWPTGQPSRLDPVETRTVEWVVDKYGGFSAEELSRMTDQEVPWVAARATATEGEHGSQPISHDQMRAYYARQRSDAEVAVAIAAASAAMQGLIIDDDWREILRDIALGFRSADDVMATEIKRARQA